MINPLIKVATVGGIIGIGLTLGYKRYTKDVTIIQGNKSDTSLLINNMIKEKTTETPMYFGYRIPINDNENGEFKKMTPKSLVETMFSTWVMIPEKIYMWSVMPNYEPLTTEIGHAIFGMFKIESMNPDIAILNWKMANMEGLHVFQIKDGVAMFDTIFWSPGPLSAILLRFHHIYSKLLLTAAIEQL